jgi:polar amino acid transport system substrate-binding protein
MAALCKRFVATLVAISFLGSIMVSTQASADTLLERANAGKPIRVGYANAAPWCYEKEKDGPGGFSTRITVETLKKMGYEVELVAMPEWGGLIPGLMAKRFDVVACGLYIMAERCKSVEFANPLAVIGDVFLLPNGNPRGIQTWQDIIKSDVKVGFVAGTNSMATAKSVGMDLSRMMSFPSKTELVAALRAKRIDVGAENLAEGSEILRLHPGEFELSDINQQPKNTLNWAASGFRHEDADFAMLYNAAQQKYLGTPEMMSMAKVDSYNEQYLPQPDVTAEWVCKNR